MATAASMRQPIAALPFDNGGKGIMPTVGNDRLSDNGHSPIGFSSLLYG